MTPTLQKRICVGGYHPIGLPKSLSLPARVLPSKGIQPQVQQLQQMCTAGEREAMLERMVLMKVEPMDDSTAELPGIQGGG
ncbi:hypothetical protein niasHS_009267 [Heterodera schachtii]|uniref:Uncharacterized protein n=2 Tax=Heterodera TaxID=34509 RepID=A0ABD2IZ09_HETSC